MTVIDAHHHFWRFDPSQYPWIAEEARVLRRDYLPAQLRETLAGTEVESVISVQARASIQETDFLLEQARALPLVRGVVGWVPLREDRAGDLLDRFIADPLFKGVREVTQGEPEHTYFTDAAFNRGLREVTRRGATYDLLIYEDQLPAAIRFVDAHPEQRFVLDHLGKPLIRRGAVSGSWRRDFQRLAARPQIACKLSGVVTEVRDETWSLDTIRRCFDVAWEAFGPDRLMFGSDWPVCLPRATYGEWLETVHQLLEPLAPRERAAVLADTASAWYRL